MKILKKLCGDLKNRKKEENINEIREELEKILFRLGRYPNKLEEKKTKTT